MISIHYVVEKRRTGEPLPPKERKVHEHAACGVLRNLHDELDQLVADAYRWPWPHGDRQALGGGKHPETLEVLGVVSSDREGKWLVQPTQSASALGKGN